MDGVHLIGTHISQYASYSAMFCLLHSNISKEQHKKYLCKVQSIQPYLNTWKP